MRHFIFFSLSLLFTFPIFGQIQGMVTDQNGNALPYVNVYVENTSIGTTTNFEGFYSLKLEKGLHKLVFQYIGFKNKSYDIKIQDRIESLDVIMEEERYVAPEVVIKANAEDPAYAIIRKAQAKRNYYKELYNNFECDAYMRGFNKIYDAPEKILGVEVGDLDGTLDTTRQGVVYLSESVSKLYKKGRKSKEVMYSSKVSGDDQGYSFNSAKEMDFNFYGNTVELNRKIISPIASDAMRYYKYKLEGAKMDERGQLINKIKVTPKNEYAPVFHGHIYINEDLWNINSLELSVSKEASQLPFIDTLTFKQSFIPLEAPDKWYPISMVINFRMGAFGFDFGGNFACVYSNYVIGEVDDEVFNREVFKVESAANTKNEMYWDSIRPIPLTVEERVDYHRKDSIRIVRNSPEYLDSIDRENNKFQVLDIIGSYSRQNSQKFTAWTYTSPLSSLQVNTLQGYNADVKIGYSKAYDKQRSRYFNITTKVNYGFSDKVLRPRLDFIYRANRTNNMLYRLSFGRDVTQFNRQNPISPSLNTTFTLLARRNYLKAFDNTFVNLRLSRDLGYMFTGRLGFRYERRQALENQFNSSLYFKDSREFTPNLEPFEDHNAFLFDASLRIKIGEEIWSYPNSKFKVGSDWPTIWFHYTKAIAFEDGDAEFDLLRASIFKQYVISTVGRFSGRVNLGWFINAPNYFVDYRHFNGNQTHIGNPSNYYYRFLNMPYYRNSANGNFVEMHFQHQFNGFILSKVPLIKKLGWHLVAGAKYLSSENQGDYRELHIGIDNIGYKLFRLFRVDAVWSWQDCAPFENCDGTAGEFGVVLGIKIGQ